MRRSRSPSRAMLNLLPQWHGSLENKKGSHFLVTPTDQNTLSAATTRAEVLATVPLSVSFGPGETIKSFTITTKPVLQSKSVIISAKTSSGATSTKGDVGIAGSAGGFTVTRTDALNVDPPMVTGMTIAPSSVRGGDGASGQVNLSGPAPAGFVIFFSSSDGKVAFRTGGSGSVPVQEGMTLVP